MGPELAGAEGYGAGRKSALNSMWSGDTGMGVELLLTDKLMMPLI